jgi:ABC-type polysaccharide/polyol phosphate transport system ATPase subunit
VIDNIKDYCQRAGVLHQGRLHMFEDVASAYAFYQEATA